MLRARLLTAAVVLPLLVLVVCCGPSWLFAAVLLSLSVIGLAEYFTMVREHCIVPPWVGVAWGLAVASAMLVSESPLVSVALLGGFFGIFVWALQDSQPLHGVHSVSLSLLGVVYVGFLLPHFIWIHRSPDGVAWVFFIFLVAMLGDTGGYAVGRIWGRRKLLPHISPGKTVEGSGGAVFGNLCAAGVAWVWFFPQRSLAEIGCLALVTGGMAQAGDLCESALKRAFGVKDSGWVFPGHGGVLDRIDSLLFPAAFIYYYITLVG